MLAETVGSDVAAIHPTGKFHRRPGDVEFADRRVPHAPYGSALAQMRMSHGLVQGENGRARHAFRFQRRDGRVAAGKTTKPALDDGLERSVVVASGARRVEARII